MTTKNWADMTLNELAEDVRNLALTRLFEEGGKSFGHIIREGLWQAIQNGRNEVLKELSGVDTLYLYVWKGGTTVIAPDLKEAREKLKAYLNVRQSNVFKENPIVVLQIAGSSLIKFEPKVLVANP